MEDIITTLERIKGETLSLEGIEDKSRLISLVDETIDTTEKYVSDRLALSVFLKEMKQFKKHKFATLEGDKDFATIKSDIIRTFAMLNTI